MGKPTISDVAKAAGLSVTTVSHAFSGRRHVDPATRERIHAIAQELGYHPSSVAQQLRSGRTGTIALASSMPFAVAAGPSRLGFLMEIAASAAMAAFSRDIALCLIPPQPSPANLNQMGFDGVILVEPERDDPLVRHFEARRTPVVTIGKVPEREDIPAIDLYSAEGTRLLLDHLWENGARQIALLTGASERTSHLEARRIYAEFAATQGFSPQALLLDEAKGEGGAKELVTHLLRDHPEINGLLVPVDAFASGAVAAAKDLGKSIPGELSIATRYDGLRAKLSEPPLTALDLHLSQLAEAAVALLLAHIEGAPGVTPVPVPSLVPRRSSLRREG
ncbi:LacI family DNA-binding transcriptional regulator [Paracoccus sulfuroxidans]|uniref:LacI family transcriptional regulator n=1 Tax=Paracoccus sulfuroxidans TaxID=384678 RepID=A0A562NAZ3_9RHOB|nr:LacI family DNA-binding transcriptional regulator [Paracoccus sulfuroxidans]TWI29263.1 LacI family transcriptional regulator [Paracoccus sulfuroxidans]